MLVKRLLEDAGLMMFIGIIVALLLTQQAAQMKDLIIPLFMVVIGLLMRKTFQFSKTRAFKIDLGSIINALFINYVVLGAVLVLLGMIFLNDPEYWPGLIALIAVPVPASLITFAFVMNADLKYSFLGEVASYLVSIAVIPVVFLLGLGQAVDVSSLVPVVLLLIVVPLVVSYFTRTRVAKTLDASAKAVTGFFLFFIVYISIGLNYDFIVTQFVSLWPIVAMMIAKVVLLGFGVLFLANKFLGVDKKRAIGYALFASTKNAGMAVTLSLVLLGNKALLVPLISGVIDILFVAVFAKV